MKKYIYLIIILFTTQFCKKDDNTYSGTTQIAFDNDNYIAKILPTETNGEHIIKLPLTLLGNSTTEQKSYTITIDTSAENFKTEYLKFESTQTFGANLFTDSLTINIAVNKLQEGTDTWTTLKIESNQNNIANNYNICTLHIIKDKFISLFTGTYSCYETTSYDTYITTFERVSRSDSSILNTNFWNFNAFGYTLTYIINKEQKTIDIPEQEWRDSANNVYNVWGNGTFELNGKMIVDYNMQLEGHIEIYEKGTHIFTPIK